jgi:flagellar basal-body rod protein FlgB
MLLDRTGLELGHFLSYLSRRQEVIASNIANADTPDYKTRDVEPPGSFTSALRDAAPEPSGAIVEPPGLPSRNDGNNVSIDREARLLAETTLKFNVSAQLIRSELRAVRSAIEEGRAA